VNHLEQALMGLITNALEATPRGGVVTVRTKSSNHSGDGKTVQVSIEDTGEGIPVENRERVFEPFFTTKPHGTGIGLPLAKKFLERNGATITISDVAGAGTKVAITLPPAL
jgi:two-component system sensor histidine kinase AtoS